MATKKEVGRTNKLPRDRSVPRNREGQLTDHGLDPTAREYYPSDKEERYLATLTDTLQKVVQTDQASRQTQNRAYFEEALADMEEKHQIERENEIAKAREREDKLTALLEQLVLSNNNAKDQAQKTEKERLEQARIQRIESKERWEAEKKTLKSIEKP